MTQLPQLHELLSTALTQEEIRELIKQLQTKLVNATQLQSVISTSTDTIPLQIFSTSLAPAEAVVKYLKENNQLSYHEIGVALNRDERGIWGTYHRSKQKMPQAFSLTKLEPSIPISLLAIRKQSILENVISYLIDILHYSFSAAAQLLDKKYSTVYTTYHRVSKKGYSRTVFNTPEAQNPTLDPHNKTNPPTKKARQSPARGTI